MRTIAKSIVMVLIIFVTVSVTAAPFDVRKLEAALATHITGSDRAGLITGIVIGDKHHILHLGTAAKTSGQTISADSIFEIGSITKTMTGILLADMVLKGEVQLDDPIANYLPQAVTVPTYDGEKITLKHLATHTSALPRLPSNLDPANIKNPYADFSVQHMYDFLSSYELSREIGATAEYSNLGMGLLGHILSLKAGMSYERLITARILKPLGMNDTTITVSGERRERLTTGHDELGNATGHWDLPTFAGAGALRSTGRDMMRYLSANMGLEQSSLSDAIEKSHQFQHEFEVAERMSIGLAWLTTSRPDGNIIWHNGGTGGYRSFIGFNKQEGRGVVVLINSLDNADAIGMAILADDINAIEQTTTEAVSHPAEYLQTFVGDYQLAPSFILSISEADGQLYAQATGQQMLPVYAKSDLEFFYKAVDASLTFVKEDGQIVSLILHQNGDHLAKKIK